MLRRPPDTLIGHLRIKLRGLKNQILGCLNLAPFILHDLCVAQRFCLWLIMQKRVLLFTNLETQNIGMITLLDLIRRIY